MGKKMKMIVTPASPAGQAIVGAVLGTIIKDENGSTSYSGHVIHKVSYNDGAPLSHADLGRMCGVSISHDMQTRADFTFTPLPEFTGNWRVSWKKTSESFEFVNEAGEPADEGSFFWVYEEPSVPDKTNFAVVDGVAYKLTKV